VSLALTAPAGLAPRVREATAARGIGLASVQGTFNMSHPDPEFRASGLRRLRLIASLCGELGAQVVAICIGTRNRDNMWGHHPDNETPEAWRDMTGCARQAVRIAEDAQDAGGGFQIGYFYFCFFHRVQALPAHATTKVEPTAMLPMPTPAPGTVPIAG